MCSTGLLDYDSSYFCLLNWLNLGVADTPLSSRRVKQSSGERKSPRWGRLPSRYQMGVWRSSLALGGIRQMLSESETKVKQVADTKDLPRTRPTLWLMLSRQHPPSTQCKLSPDARFCHWAEGCLATVKAWRDAPSTSHPHPQSSMFPQLVQQQ